MSELEDKSTWHLAWAVLWRMWILSVGIWIVLAIITNLLLL